MEKTIIFTISIISLIRHTMKCIIIICIFNVGICYYSMILYMNLVQLRMVKSTSIKTH